jgi:hypothetical protein
LTVSDADLRRVRDDLDTIRHAAGLETTCDRADIGLALMLVPSGLILAGWAAAGPSGREAWGLAPAVLVVAVALVRWAGRRGADGRRRETRIEATTTAAVGLGMAALIAWEKWLHLPHLAVRGAGLFMAGVACAAVGVAYPSRRVYLAGALALIPFGLAAPLLSPTGLPIVGGLLMAACGLATAAALARQLRADRGPA